MAKHQNFNLIKIKSQKFATKSVGELAIKLHKKKKHFFWISIFFSH